MSDRPWFASVVLAMALIVSAWLVGHGIERFRVADRYVTVKGVAERTIRADVGLWPLRFVSAEDDLERAQRKIVSDRRAVLAFLVRYGIDSTATELQSLEVTDTRANPYRDGRESTRVIVAMTMMVRTNDPDRIQTAGQHVGELLQQGIVLSGGPFGGGEGAPTYVFTRLNDLKPTMLAEANANARKAAAEFAKESHSHVGRIRRASQGVFEILAHDQAPGVMESRQIQKTLRVVATVDYYLSD